jgi:hypothetical protein
MLIDRGAPGASAALITPGANLRHALHLITHLRDANERLADRQVGTPDAVHPEPPRASLTACVPEEAASVTAAEQVGPVDCV